MKKDRKKAMEMELIQEKNHYESRLNILMRKVCSLKRSLLRALWYTRLLGQCNFYVY